ncbi:MAG: radical SAM protein [Desulfurococcaceae archaeon]
MLNILVVDCLARAGGSRYSTFDVAGAGPRIVAGLVEEHGFNVKLEAYELAIKKRFDNIHLLFISAMSSDILAVRKFIYNAVKRGFRGIVVLGGPVSIGYRDVLSRFEEIDYVVVGEGEIPVEKILVHIDALISRDENVLRKIPALAYRNSSGDVVLTTPPIHTPIDKLSKLKPWVRVNESYPYYRAIRFYVEVVRGCSNFRRPRIKSGELKCIDCGFCLSNDFKIRLKCPSNIPPGCGFCSVPYVFGSPRSRSVDSIVDEIEGLISHGAERIVLSAPDLLDYGREKLVEPNPLTDPCYPNANIDALEDLLNAIFSIEDVASGRVTVMVENIKSCLVNEDVAKLLGRFFKDTSIHIGVETGDDWFNDYVLGKPISSKQVVNAVKLLREAGLRPYIYLMHSLPFENIRVYDNTVKLVKQLAKIGVEKITLYKFKPIPGSAFEKLKVETCFPREVNRLKKIVSRVNRVGKKAYLNRTLEVYIVKNSRGCYGYPVKHGPVVVVKNTCRDSDEGYKAIVKITGVSDRVVYGEVLREIY